jgi:predicted nucleic acid-binding protein
VAVDTSVLLAIFKGEPRGELWLETLQSAAEAASLLLSSVVLAEVRSFFPSDDACRKALRDLDLKHSPLTEEASLLAGKIFRTYRSEGGPRTTILLDFWWPHTPRLKQTRWRRRIEAICALIFPTSDCFLHRRRTDLWLGHILNVSVLRSMLLEGYRPFVTQVVRACSSQMFAVGGLSGDLSNAKPRDPEASRAKANDASASRDDSATRLLPDKNIAHCVYHPRQAGPIDRDLHATAFHSVPIFSCPPMNAKVVCRPARVGSNNPD